MTVENSEFALTNHVIIRYSERKRTKKPVKTQPSREELVAEIMTDVEQSVENRAILNNTHFMAHIVDTYGTERYSIYVSDASGMVYVVVNKPHVKLVLTCYHRDTSALGHLRKRKRY